MKNSIGLVEVNSVAKGFDVTDTMLKTSKVELLVARSICPGKYIVLIAGEVAQVKSSVEAGIYKGEASLVDTLVIPNVHQDIFPAITGSVVVGDLKALGVIETFSVASLIESADAAAKAADVKLIEVRLAMALGGKAFVTMTGTVAAVGAAVEAGAASAGDKGLLVQKIVIPNPKKELLREFI